MKKENYDILRKYLERYDEAHDDAWEKEKERLGWDKDGDEKWRQFLEDRQADFEETAAKNRRWYRYTVQEAIEAKEEGKSFPMFPIPEDVN